MTEATEAPVRTDDTAAEDAELRIYEAGYLILPTVSEDEIEGVVAGIRGVIEKAGGTFIAEGAPVSTRLAYTMFVNRAGKRYPYERASFGWIKFEVAASAANALHDYMQNDPSILRSIVFKTVREDTRASARPVLREVRRTDTITSTPSKGAGENAGVVSEVALDKSIENLIAE